jgi:hypothetical protein
MAVFASYGTEKLGALGEKTDITGAYTIGPIHFGNWNIEAEPSMLYPNMVPYDDHAPGLRAASLVSAPEG